MCIRDRYCLSHSIDNCVYANPSVWGSCLACEPTYELISGKCVFMSIVSSYLCKTRNTNGECDSCYDGYKLSNGGCTAASEVNQIDGCITYDHHNYLCLECESTLLLSNGYCKAMEIKDCELLDPNNSHCQVCKEGFFLRGYTCCLLYTSPSPRDLSTSRMPSSA